MGFKSTYSPFFLVSRLLFQYANVPINLLFQVYLIPNGQGNNANEVGNEDLEIDEVNPDETFVEENSINMIHLTSKAIKKERYSLERYTCPLWIQGLERSFKVRKIFNSFRKQNYENMKNRSIRIKLWHIKIANDFLARCIHYTIRTFAVKYPPKILRENVQDHIP